MKFSYAALMAGVSIAALATSAHAQAPAAGEQQVDEIVVTGSRVLTNGNAAPMPFLGRNWTWSLIRSNCWCQIVRITLTI